MSVDSVKDADSESAHFLSAFQRLGPQIYFYHPMLSKTANSLNGDDAKTATTATNEPNLIIICSWMAAASRHIAKYTDKYLSRYPQVPTLLVRSSQRDLMVKTEGSQLEDIRPAITAIQSVFGSADTKTPIRVLMHIFSNGGGWTAGLLTEAYKKATSGLEFPITAFVIDSCPSYPDIRLSYFALAAILPKNFIIRMLGSMVIWIFLVLVRIINKLGITENLVLKVRQVLNNQAGPFMKGAIPRVYICSQSDKMVPIQDVKQHAEEAQATMVHAGLSSGEAEKRVKLEEFVGSPHVGHLMIDKDRYWKIVDNVWEEGIRVQLSNLKAIGLDIESEKT